MKNKKLSICKYAVIKSICPGILWTILGVLYLLDFKEKLEKPVNFIILILLIPLLILMILGLIMERETSDELVYEHENKSKIFSYQFSLLTCIIVILLQNIPFFHVSIPLTSSLAFVASLMYLLEGVSFLIYEKLDSSNVPDDVLPSREGTE